jgi:methyl-accepting chemotaxis protein
MFNFGTIKAKLYFMILIFSIGMVLIGIIGLSGAKRANNSMERMYNGQLSSVLQIFNVRAPLNAILREMSFAVAHNPANPSSALVQKDHQLNVHIDAIEKNLNEIGPVWQEFEKKIDSPEERKLADAFTTSKNEFIEKAVRPALESLKKGDYDEASRLVYLIGKPLSKKVSSDSQLLMELQLKQAKDHFQQNDASFRKLEIWTIACILGGVLFAVIIGVLISSTITTSAKRLIATATEIGNGNLTARCSLTGKDEMAEIASSFDQIASVFTSSMNNLATIAAEVTIAAARVHTSSEAMASGSEKVASEAATVATAGEEMAATSGDIAQNCQMAAESAQQASSQAADGSAIIRNSINGMQKIAERVSDSARTVESLGQRSDQIGQIIGTIQDIADQTNLLALNAAIEAARAGDQGRGFAVVADEVRALAERTTKATKEIDSMIKAIQQETRAAVSAMEEGVAQVRQGTEEARRSGVAIDTIMEQIDGLSLQVSQIATAAEEQTATTSEISGNMMRITDVVSQSSASAQESAGEANHLNELAEKLMVNTNKFQLEESMSLSILRAKGAHLIFTGKIRAHLAGVKQVDHNGLPTHLTCAFGKWCQSIGKDTCGDMPQFRQIEAPHSKVHDLGKQAVQAYNAGDRQRAHEYCDEMVAQSEKLLDILDQLMGESATLMKWGPQYSINVRMFDDQHKRLIDMVNQLNDAMNSGKGFDVLKTILGGLVEYTVTHFDDEERILTKNNYPDLAAHKKEHEALKKTAGELMQKFNGNSNALSSEVMVFLKNWLVTHIQGSDKKYAQFLNSKGIS